MFQELNAILKVADSLQIRGLTSNVQVPPVNDDILMMTENEKVFRQDFPIMPISKSLKVIALN